MSDNGNEYVEVSEHRLLFVQASPLITKNAAGEKLELPMLDSKQEVACILRAMNDSNRKLYFRYEIATTEKLRKQVSRH